MKRLQCTIGLDTLSDYKDEILTDSPLTGRSFDFSFVSASELVFDKLSAPEL